MTTTMSRTAARAALIRAALRVLSAEHGEDHGFADAEAEYADEELAKAARALTQATDELPAGERPVGWSPGTAEPFTARLPVRFADDHGSMWAYRGIEGEPLFNLRLAAPGDGGRSVTLDLDDAERLATAVLATVRAIRQPLPGGTS